MSSSHTPPPGKTGAIDNGGAETSGELGAIITGACGALVLSGWHPQTSNINGAIKGH